MKDKSDTEWISRSEAARRLGRSRTMVRKYCDRGMRFRASDGKIAWPAAADWVEKNIIPELSGSWMARQCITDAPVHQTKRKGATRCLNAAERVREVKIAARRELLDHMMQNVGAVASLMLACGRRDMTEIIAAVEALESLLMYLGGDLATECYDTGDESRRHPEPNYQALAEMYDIDGDPEEWYRGADAMLEVFDSLMY